MAVQKGLQSLRKKPWSSTPPRETINPGSGLAFVCEDVPEFFATECLEDKQVALGRKICNLARRKLSSFLIGLQMLSNNENDAGRKLERICFSPRPGAAEGSECVHCL